MTKVYVTKFAITHGIFEVEGNIDPRDGWVLRCKNIHGSTLFYPDEYRITAEEAILVAESLRSAKIALIQNKSETQISRLKNKVIRIHQEKAKPTRKK